MSFFFQTLANSGDLLSWGYSSIVVVTLCLVFDYYMPTNPRGLLGGLTYVLTVYLTINYFIMIRWPDGIIDGIYFIGIRTRFTEVMLPLSSYTLLYDWMSKKRISLRSIYVFALMLASLITQWVATALIGLGSMVLCFVVLSWWKWLTRWLTLSKALVMTLVLNVGVVVLQIQNWFAWLIVNILNKDLSITFRTELWALAIKEICKSPLWGFGQSDNGTFITWERSTRLWQSHNQWLQLLHDGGLILVAFFCAMLLLANRPMHRRSSTKQTRIILSCFVAFLVMMTSEVYTYTPYFYLLVFIAFHVADVQPQEAEGI